MHDDKTRDLAMSVLLTVRGNSLALIEALANGSAVPDETVLLALVEDAVYSLEEAYKLLDQ